MDEELTLTELIAKSRVMHAFLPDDDTRTVNEYTADEISAAGYQKVSLKDVWAAGAKHGFEDYRGKFDATLSNVLVGNPYNEEEQACHSK